MRSETVSLAAEASAPPSPIVAGKAVRRRARPRGRSSASIVPLALAVLGGAFAYEALQDRSAETAIVVASATLPAGSAVDAADTKVVRVHASDRLLAKGLLSPSQLTGGFVAAVPIRAGDAVTSGELGRPDRGVLGEMSIAVPLQQAAGGAIDVGDEVDVIASPEAGESYYVAQGLRVLAVAPTSGVSGALGGGTDGYFVVVGVDKQTALRLAAALSSGGLSGAADEVQVVRSTGEAVAALPGYQAPVSIEGAPLGPGGSRH
ncbi:MAG TPA: SAF domain-containing protein [Acidimicrobiales bacterium]|nr:SAF domain-containing protein [Acidimicrobiales bacterium]